MERVARSAGGPVSGRVRQRRVPRFQTETLPYPENSFENFTNAVSGSFPSTSSRSSSATT